jgi:hypothetical protein
LRAVRRAALTLPDGLGSKLAFPYEPRRPEQTARVVAARGVHVSIVRLPQVHDRRKQGLVTPAGGKVERAVRGSRSSRRRIVTAKLWVRGIEDGAPVAYVEWFSDTYVRTPQGWRYVFGQASLPLSTHGDIKKPAS